MAAAGAGVVVVTVRGCLDEEAATPATQQMTTTTMTMGITKKSTRTPTVTPTTMPTMLTPPRGLESVWYSNCLFCRRVFFTFREIILSAKILVKFQIPASNDGLHCSVIN